MIVKLYHQNLIHNFPNWSRMIWNEIIKINYLSCKNDLLDKCKHGSSDLVICDVIDVSELRQSIFVKTWSVSEHIVKLFTFIIHLDCLCVIEKYFTQLTHYSSARDTIMVVTKIDHNTTVSVFIYSRGLENWFI